MTTPQTPGEDDSRSSGGWYPPGDPRAPQPETPDPYWSGPDVTPPPGGGSPTGGQPPVYGSQPQQPDQPYPGGQQPQQPGHPGGQQPGQYQQPGGYGPPPGGGYGPPPTGPGGPGGPGASDPRDPLFATDISGWWRNATGVFARSWRSIGALMLVGVAIPSWVVGTTYNYSMSRNAQSSRTWTDDGWGFQYQWSGDDVVGQGLAPLLLALVLAYLTASAWSGALRASAIEAAGGTTAFGANASYGFARGVKLWGWGLLAWLTVAVGLVLCVVPGLWALFALSLIAPVTVFERVNSYTRSIKLAHSRFGPTLGRLFLTWLVVAVYTCVVGCLGGLILAAFGVHSPGGASDVTAFVLILIVQAVEALLQAVAATWMVGALLCTYADVRGHAEPVSAVSLATEADR